MATISIKTTDQVLSFVDIPRIACGDVGTDKLSVDLCSSWTGYTVTAVFYTDDNKTKYSALLDANDECVIPYEVLCDHTKLYIGLVGVDDSKILTSTLLTFNILEGAKLGDGVTTTPTATVYAQILADYETIINGNYGGGGGGGGGGADGADGADGASAYDIWIELGNSGTKQDFIDSLKGADGEDGADGADGANGTGGSLTKYGEFENLIYDNFFKCPYGVWNTGYMSDRIISEVFSEYTNFTSSYSSTKSFNQYVSLTYAHVYVALATAKLNSATSNCKMRLDISVSPYILSEVAITASSYTKVGFKYTATSTQSAYLTFADTSTNSLDLDLKDVVFVDVTGTSLASMEISDIVDLYNPELIDCEHVYFDIQTATENMFNSAKDDSFVQQNSDDSVKDFWKTSGTKFVDSNDNEVVIRAIGLVNNCLNINSADYSSVLGVTNGKTDDHNEESWRQIKELGFNAVRFYMNYEFFENPDNPVSNSNGDPDDYKTEGWTWLDKEVALARKYNIRMILNMHIPNGNGASEIADNNIWTTATSKTRLINLWKAIARRYVSEDIIVGFGLINEPNIIYQTDEATTIGVYETLTNNIITAIRTVDTNHIIFSEMAICSVNGTTKDYYLNDNNNFVSVTDSADNYCYEMHHYEPLDITHSASSDMHPSIVYPNPYAVYGWSSDAWLAEQQKEKTYISGAGNDTDFVDFSTDLTTPTSNSTAVKFIRPYLRCNLAQGNEVVKIKDFAIDLYNSNGDFYKTIFEDDCTCGNIFSTNSNFGTMTMPNGEGCLQIIMSAISSATRCSVNDSVVIASRWRIPVGYKYKLRCKLKVTNVSASGNLTLSLSAEEYNPTSSYAFTEEMHDFIIGNYKDSSDTAGVPLFIGEYGCKSNSYIDMERGGDIWIDDCLKYLLENKIASNFHCYCDWTNFGLMRDSKYLNKRLAQIFDSNNNEFIRVYENVSSSGESVVYSTTEKEIGEYGTEKVYRKCFTTSATSLTADTDTFLENTGIDDISKVLNIKGIAKKTDSDTYGGETYVCYDNLSIPNAAIEMTYWMDGTPNQEYEGIYLKPTTTATYDLFIEVIYTKGA